MSILRDYTGILIAFGILAGSALLGALGAPLAEDLVRELFVGALAAGGIAGIRAVRNSRKSQGGSFDGD